MSLPRVGRSKKTEVVRYLGQRFLAGELQDGMVFRHDVAEAIAATGAALSDGNAANFLKDLLRKNPTANWPQEFLALRLYGRQVYGEMRVMQFFYAKPEEDPFADDDNVPEDLPIHTISSLPMDSLARSLGRTEETWITQVIANLDLIGHQLSIYSPDAANIRDLRFLQVGMKTQPEIDAVFVSTYSYETARHETVFITLEVKQRGERILFNQIREQVRKAFEETEKLTEEVVHAVRPMVANVIEKTTGDVAERLICIREYKKILRTDFNASFARKVAPEAIYDLPLILNSCVGYRLKPAVKAVGFPRTMKPPKPTTVRKAKSLDVAQDQSTLP